MKRFFLTGTGTDVGKTYVGVALLAALKEHGSVRGIKPYETGVDASAVDEAALQEASSGNWYHEGYFRCKEPLAPAATNAPLPSLEAVARQIDRDSCTDFVLVEGAGGLLVPLARGRTSADLALLLGDPLILVTYDGLGTLSHTLTAWESATARGLEVAAVVLNRGACSADPSQASNARILEEMGVAPIFVVERNAPLSAFGTIAQALAAR